MFSSVISNPYNIKGQGMSSFDQIRNSDGTLVALKLPSGTEYRNLTLIEPLYERTTSIFSRGILNLLKGLAYIAVGSLAAGVAFIAGASLPLSLTVGAGVVAISYVAIAAGRAFLR